jgi:hypothetical protein
MSIYKPTWLYIKEHNQTGLKYFGKTTKADPFNYNGSGKYWKRHIKKYGNDVTTVWCQLFLTESELTDYALSFSIKNNIVESNEWANLKLENGLDGGSYTITNDTKIKMSLASTGRFWSDATKQKVSLARSSSPTRGMLGKKHSEETKQKIRNSEKGKVVSADTRLKISKNTPGKLQVCCMSCKRTITGLSNLSQYHGQNCKGRSLKQS